VRGGTPSLPRRSTGRYLGEIATLRRKKKKEGSSVSYRSSLGKKRSKKGGRPLSWGEGEGTPSSFDVQEKAVGKAVLPTLFSSLSKKK